MSDEGSPETLRIITEYLHETGEWVDYEEKPPIEKLEIYHYRAKDKLGVGSNGQVFLMEDLQNNRNVAMKIQPLNKGTRELEALRTLRGIPGIPEVLDDFDAGPHHFLVTPLNLCNFTNARHVFDKQTVCRVGVDLLVILKAVHDRGLVHRDIKPDNIMIGPTCTENRLILCDFGLAHPIGELNDDANFAPHPHTSLGMARGQAACPLDDIFELGRLLQCLRCSPPSRQNNQALMTRKKAELLRNPEKFCKGENQFLLPFWEKIKTLWLTREPVTHEDFIALLERAAGDRIVPGEPYKLARVNKNYYFVNF